MDILRTNDIKSRMTLVLAFFALLKHQLSIWRVETFFKLTVIGLRCSFILNRNQSLTESKARISFIVIPIDLTMPICRYTNPSYFFSALMLVFSSFGCCGRVLNFGRFTFVIAAVSFNLFSTKLSLWKFLYRSFPSSTKVKMHFVTFSVQLYPIQSY